MIEWLEITKNLLIIGFTAYKFGKELWKDLKPEDKRKKRSQPRKQRKR